MTKTHIAKKRFGQNFLHDEYIINEIIKIISPKPTDLIVEIGPGLGALTMPLIAKVGKLEVIEIDWDIISFLQKNFTNGQINIHSADALKFDYSFNQRLIRVVGNLPYNISTPLLFHLAVFKNIQDMHFMLQKEVVERICARPNSKDYGRLSVMLQYKFICDKMLDVAAASFKPQPKVESAIVRLKPLSIEARYIVDEKVLNTVVTHAFGQRRKTIGNSLKNIINPETFIKLGINTNLRAENLSVAQYVLLANSHTITC
ncbi:MAG: rRNA methyltransferase [Burkholderiales bacterium]|jgi:16S rRNA (adenine1518-N6/adenine1519-N6)-dimethyltransferase|nr:rRNA methyltransferase [Burkholderiales bacterium]